MAIIFNSGHYSFDSIEASSINERINKSRRHFMMASISPLINKSRQSFAEETAPHINDYLGIDFPNFTVKTNENGSVILSLSQSGETAANQKADKKPSMIDEVKAAATDPTIRQLSDMEWEYVANSLGAIMPERIEISIEHVAAEYAVVRARILESQMSDAEKQMAQEQLDTIYEGVKEKFGAEMSDKLQAFLTSGNSDTDHSGIANAIGEIIDNRADEYISLLSSLLQKGEFNTLYTGESLRGIMYQQKNAAQRSKNDDEVVRVGEQEYTYGEIKGVFEAVEYLSWELDKAGFNTMDIPFEQMHYDIFFGFHGMAFSMLVGRYSNGQLADDVHSALMERFEMATEMMELDVGKVMESVRRYEKLLESESFSSDIVKQFLSHDPQWYGAVHMRIYMREWKWLLESTSNFDPKYHVGVDTYV